MFQYVTEFVGTFIFLSVILATGQALPIAVALAAVIYFGGAISGGHFNPAVTTMMYFKKNISSTNAVAYIVAQVLGGLAALWFYNQTQKSGSN